MFVFKIAHVKVAISRQVPMRAEGPKERPTLWSISSRIAEWRAAESAELVLWPAGERTIIYTRIDVTMW